MENMEKWLYLWMREIITDSKSVRNSTVSFIKLKASGIYHITQSQENVRVFSARVLL